MAQYEAAFARYGLRVGQILITVSDTIAPQQYRNVRRTLDRLLDLGAVYSAPPSEPGSKRISYVPNVEDALAKVQVGGTGSNVGTGGMVTKMEAARVAAVSGIPAVLTCASNAGPAMMGDPVGTAFAPINDRGSSRRLWIGFASHPQGTLVADSGAAKAVRGGAASLLAAGVVEVKGDFAAGDAVWVDDEQGNHLAKGLVGFDSEEIPARNTRIRWCTATISYWSEPVQKVWLGHRFRFKRSVRGEIDVCRGAVVFRVAGLALQA